MLGVVLFLLLVFLLLLLPPDLLLHLQDDAGELTEVSKVLDVRQLQGMSQVDLHSLLPSWDVGISLETGNNSMAAAAGCYRIQTCILSMSTACLLHASACSTITKMTRTTKKPLLGPCLLLPELSTSPLLTPSQRERFKPKATSQAVLARMKESHSCNCTSSESLHAERKDFTSLASVKSY